MIEIPMIGTSIIFNQHTNMESWNFSIYNWQKYTQNNIQYLIDFLDIENCQISQNRGLKISAKIATRLPKIAFWFWQGIATNMGQIDLLTDFLLIAKSGKYFYAKGKSKFPQGRP